MTIQSGICRNLLILFIFAGCPNLVMGQNTVDSLKASLERKDLPDSTRIDNWLLLGDQLGYSDKGEAMNYLHSAYDLALKKHLYLKMGDALSGMGQAFYRSNNLDSCLYYLKLADPLFEKLNTPEAQGRQISSKMNMATVLRTMGNPDTAITIYLKGIDAISKTHLPDKSIKMVTAYLNIGLVYNELNQYDKALFYHRKGIQLVTPSIESNVRVLYLRLHRIHDFIKLKLFDSATHYLKSEEALFKRTKQPDIYSQLYSNWGMYYQETGKEDSALVAFNKAYRYAVESKNEFRQEGMLGKIASIHRNQKDYARSASYFEQAFELSHKIKDKPSEMFYLKNLSSLYALLKKDHLAVTYYQQYVHLSDSLNESEAKKKVNEIENKYQAEKKLAAIASLEKDNQLQKSELKRKETLNMTLIGGCLLLLLLALLSYRNFKNRNRLLLQKEILHQQQIKELEKERKLIAAESVLKGQEEERSRLARDLHDGVGGLLSGVKLSMSNMKGNVILSQDHAESFNNVISQLDQSITELRRVSHNMMPEALIRYGLKETLENYCENLNHSGNIKVELQTYGMEQRMEQGTEIVIYRIIQELLNNVIKHAEASNVLIQLVREKDRFNLTVEDDGKGFELAEAQSKGGAGLANIRARAEYLDGSVDLISAKGEGTSVHIEGNCT